MSKTLSSLSITLLMLILFLLPAQSLAREIYVSNTHPGASDNNPGHQNQPLSSISEALRRAEPGHEILVGAGTYRESLEFPRGGQQDRPITIQALQGQEVFILGSEQVENWSPAQDQIWVRQGWGTNSQQVFYDGQPLEQIGSANPLHNMSLNGQSVLQPTGASQEDMYPGSFWYDQDMGDLYVWLPDGSSPEQHQMEASVRPNIIASQGVDHIRLEGLIFAHSNTSLLGQDQAMVDIQGNNWTVEGCEFVYADLGALTLKGQNHLVQDSSFALHGSHGIGLGSLDLEQEAAESPGARDITIRNSETSYNNVRGFGFDWRAGGVRGLDQCQQVQIEEHLAVDNQGAAGIWAADFCQDMSIARSLFQDNFAGAIAQTAQELKIHNSIFAQNDFGLGLLSTQEANVQFNTFERNQYGLMALDLGLQDAPLAYNTLQNNLFQQSENKDLGILAPGFSDQGNVSNHNAFARDDHELLAEWQDDQGQSQSFTSLQDLQQQGLEQDSLLLASLWPADDPGDYVPPAGSRVINAAHSSELADELDFYGRVRNAQGTDIGAVQNISAVAEAQQSSQPSDARDKQPAETKDTAELAALQSTAQDTTAQSKDASKASQDLDIDDAAPGSATSVTVTWDDFQEPDPDGYYVYVGTKSRDYDRKIDAGSSESLTVRGLKSDKKYYITVQAYDQQGNLSEYGEEVVFDPQ